MSAGSGSPVPRPGSSDLPALLDHIERRIVAGQWPELDAELAGLHLGAEPVILVAWTRATYRASGKLPSWPASVLRCAGEFDRRGLPADRIMTGLLPPIPCAPIPAVVSAFQTVLGHMGEMSR